jgi:hypothetical protein
MKEGVEVKPEDVISSPALPLTGSCTCRFF